MSGLRFKVGDVVADNLSTIGEILSIDPESAYLNPEKG